MSAEEAKQERQEETAVYLYPILIMKVKMGKDAEQLTDAELIDKAEDLAFGNWTYWCKRLENMLPEGVAYVEWTEASESYLVVRDGKDTWYKSDGQTPEPTRQGDAIILQE